jgi:hypothetical protein
MADARRYFDSLVGSDSGTRYAGYKVRKDQQMTLNAAQQALADLNANPAATADQVENAKQTLAQERTTFELLYQDYRNLPEEVDAWATGDRVQRDLEQTRSLLGRLGVRIEAFLRRAGEWLTLALGIKRDPSLARTHLPVDKQVANAQAWITDMLAKLEARRQSLTGADKAELYEIEWLDYQISRVASVKAVYDKAVGP